MMMYAKILMGILLWQLRTFSVTLGWCCYIEHYPNVAKNASVNKNPVKNRAVSQNHSEPIFYFTCCLFIKTSELLVNNLSLLILSEP
jgi:hypothetical protein